MFYHFQSRFHLNRNRAGKIRFSGKRNSVLLKTSSGARCTPCNFVPLVTLRRTSICLTVYLIVHQMKETIKEKCLNKFSCSCIQCFFLSLTVKLHLRTSRLVLAMTVSNLRFLEIFA